MLCYVTLCLLFAPPKGGRGCLMSPPCLESLGCHWIPLYYLLSCSSAGSFYSFSCCFFLLAHSPDFYPENSSMFFSFRDRLFCMAPVLQLGEVSWLVVCAACQHAAIWLWYLLLYV